MNAPTLRTMVLSIGIAVAVLGTAGTARADDDHWRHDDRDHHEHRDHDRRYVPPPVVVVAPPPRVIYEPPPIVVAPEPGINIILPLNFN